VTHRTPLLIVAALLGLYLGWFALRAGPGPEAQRSASLPSEPVMVVVVKGHADLEAVREVIDEERIVANSLDGFVVREGRVVVFSVEAVGPLLRLAGWSDAELEIVKLEARAVLPVSASGGERNTLLAKPMLTVDEALRALQLLD
jgi:hypothetical protein